MHGGGRKTKENCIWNRGGLQADWHGFVLAPGIRSVCVGWVGMMGSIGDFLPWVRLEWEKWFSLFWLWAGMGSFGEFVP
jgi:hypothetical protein